MQYNDPSKGNVPSVCRGPSSDCHPHPRDQHFREQTSFKLASIGGLPLCLAIHLEGFR